MKDPSDQVVLSVTDLSHEGRGVARLDGKVVFIDGALPGERVLAGPLRHRGKIAEANLVRVIEASPDRRQPDCRHFEVCGGCSLQHLHYPAQVEARQAHLLRLLMRSGIEPDHLLAPVTSAEFGYRRRVRFAVNRASGRIGFRQKSSSRLVDISTCPVLVPQLQALLPTLSNFTVSLGAAKTRVDELELSRSGNQTCLLILSGQAWQPPASSQSLPGIDRVLWKKGGQTRDYFSGEPVADPPGFMQANEAVNREMLKAVLERLGPAQGKSVADFFCGAGNFSLPLATAGARVTGYDSALPLIERARKQAEESAVFRAVNLFDSRSLQSIARDLPGYDAVLLDPPRAGARDLCALLAKRGPARLMYISCHPATFARDSAGLLGGGYRMVSLQMFDMFPQTMHAELMGCFIRK